MLPGGQTPDKQNHEEKKTNKCNMCEYAISQVPSEATLENTHWRKVRQMQSMQPMRLFDQNKFHHKAKEYSWTI